MLVHLVCQLTEVLDSAFGVWVLRKDTHEIITKLSDPRAVVGQHISRLNLDTKTIGSGTKHLDGLGMAAVGNEKGLVLALLTRGRKLPQRQGHGFGGGGRFV